MDKPLLTKSIHLPSPLAFLNPTCLQALNSSLAKANNVIIILVILCKIIAPPPQVSAIHQQIKSLLEERLISESLHLAEGESGPAVVVAVNNSRIAADVKRDLAKTGKYGVFCTEKKIVCVQN
jgi:hypothetical protein